MVNDYMIASMETNWLYEAIASGDIDRLRQMIIYNDNNFLLQMTTSMKNTTLHVAVQFQRILCVEEISMRYPRLLLQRNMKGETPLHIASRLGNHIIVSFLITNVKFERNISTIFRDILPNPNIEDDEGGEAESVVISATQHLIRMENKENDTPLHDAVRNSRFKVVCLLMEADPLFNYLPNDLGETPLYIAAENGWFDFVYVMLEKCPSSTHIGPNGRTALHAAIMCGNSLGIVKLLLEKKQSSIIRETDENEWNALHYAAYVADVETTIQLLETDPSIADMVDKDGKTALHIAASSRIPRNVGYKLKNYGNSSFNFSFVRFRRESIEVIKEVIKKWPESWEKIDKNGQNFLHIASEHGSWGVIYYVLKKSDMSENLINEKDNNGNTPLHSVLRSSSVECVRLIATDPRINKRAINKDNLTALDIVLNNLKVGNAAVFSGSPLIPGDDPEGDTEDSSHEKPVEDGNSMQSKEGLYQDFLEKSYEYLYEGGSIWCGRRRLGVEQGEEERYHLMVLEWNEKQREKSKEMSTSQTILAGLIVGITSRARPPGGKGIEEHNSKGMIVWKTNSPLLNFFAVMNGGAMFLATTVLIIHFTNKIVHNKGKVMIQTLLTHVFLLGSILAVWVTFVIRYYILLGPSVRFFLPFLVPFFYIFDYLYAVILSRMKPL